jgi:prevent-host-death family protein
MAGFCLIMSPFAQRKATFCTLRHNQWPPFLDQSSRNCYHEVNAINLPWAMTMSVKVFLHELQDRLPELLDQVAKTGEEYVVRRNGKDCAVIVSARQWRRRNAATRLDALGSKFRITSQKQTRVEELLAANPRRPLTPAEGRELKALVRECDAIMLRRASALDQLP